ncbi:MAG: SPOR domain-containing protein [Gammaproteobacteria bacterium]|nr:SPOR domain-containing protein [Gammaproteobacteria bacterium]
MAKRRKRRSGRSKSSGYRPVVWMLFGLAIGLSVAFAVYINSREPARVTQQSTPQPASMQSALDDNGETAPEPEPAPAPVRKDKRFTFYDILPNVEILTSDSAMQAPADSTPKAVEEPGVYVLQAGSFSTNADADRRRAELALQGIESHIQRVKVNDRDYHRVYIGPTDDLDELNMLRSRLRAAQIDVLRIRVGD